MTFWERQNYGETKRVSGYQGFIVVEGFEMNRWSSEEF